MDSSIIFETYYVLFEDHSRVEEILKLIRFRLKINRAWKKISYLCAEGELNPALQEVLIDIIFTTAAKSLKHQHRTFTLELICIERKEQSQ